MGDYGLQATTQALDYAREDYIKVGHSFIFDRVGDMIYKAVVKPNLNITGTDPERQMYWQFTATGDIASQKQLQALQIKASWAGGTTDSAEGNIVGAEIKARASSDSVTNTLGTAIGIIGNVDAKKATFTVGRAIQGVVDIASGGTIETAVGVRAFLNNSGTANASYAFLVESETAGPWGYGFYSASGEATVGMFLGGTQKIEFYDDGVYINSPANGKLKLSADGTGADDITLSGTVTLDDGIKGAKSTGAATNSNGIWEILTIDGVVSNSVSGMRCLVITDETTARTPGNIFGGNFSVRLLNAEDKATGLLAGVQVTVDMGPATGGVAAYGVNIDFSENVTRQTPPRGFIAFGDYDYVGSHPCVALFDIGGSGSSASSGNKAAQKLVSTEDVNGAGASDGGIQILVNGTPMWLATYGIT